MLTWSACEDVFRVDGSLRDIYVRETSLEDWELFWNFLSGYERAYFLDHVAQDLPQSAAVAFAAGQTAAVLLKISLHI